MNFREALLEVYREDMFPVRKISIKYELDNMFPSQEEVTDINEYRFDYQKYVCSSQLSNMIYR